MDRVWGANVSQTPPTIPADAPVGYPTDGSSTGGVPSTVPKAFWYYAIMEEIRNAILGGGITPDRNDLNQLNQSIEKRIAEVKNLLRPMIESVQTQLQTMDVVPSGMLGWFATPQAPNDQWLVCDGRAVPRAGYPKLFAAIGTTYGAGDGTTSFNLPNLIGRVAWGADSGIGEKVDAGLPNITGQIAKFNNWISGNSPSGAFYSRGSGGEGVKSGHADAYHVVDMDASRCSEVYGRSETVQPPAIKVLPCIHI